MKYLDFKREGNEWYIVLPEWTGDKKDLQMVLGADSMLDILSQGDNEVFLTVDEIPFDGYSFKLSFYEDESDGGWYKLKSDLYEFDVWLCKVTKFVYDGKLPKTLFLK